jgi:hypothetical protein
MIAGYFINVLLQKIIKPKGSLARMFAYFFFVLVSVFVLSFLMVLVILKIYPGELMK